MNRLRFNSSWRATTRRHAATAVLTRDVAVGNEPEPEKKVSIMERCSTLPDPSCIMCKMQRTAERRLDAKVGMCSSVYVDDVYSRHSPAAPFTELLGFAVYAFFLAKSPYSCDIPGIRSHQRLFTPTGTSLQEPDPSLSLPCRWRYAVPCFYQVAGICVCLRYLFQRYHDISHYCEALTDIQVKPVSSWFANNRGNKTCCASS